MSRRRRPAGKTAPRRSPAPRRESQPPTPTPEDPKALAAVGLIAAISIAVSVSFELADTDFWQHLLVGKAIWTLHQIPTTQVWSWPTYGAPDANASWGFRALIWPVWQAGGLVGLFAWRWLSTLAAFALLWLTARRMGARGVGTFVVLVVCALIYRQRSQIRPETLVAILLALELWILETRRQGGPDRKWWLVAVAWAWANAHISYHLFFVVLGIHAFLGRAPRPDRALLAVGLAALGIAFVNPFGWRALWQPFDYFLNQRNEPIYRGIGELLPIQWGANLTNGLPLLMVGWPVVWLLRTLRRGPDLVEGALCAIFSLLAISTQRFVGFYALVAAPYLARHLSEWIERRRWPSWSRPPLARAALGAAACVAIAVPEWARLDLPLRIGVDERDVPIAACDFMATHDVRGRGFNDFAIGGYLLWRFWPERERLPFMEIHQAGTPELRRLYMDAVASEAEWRALDGQFRFDWVLLARPRGERPGPPDLLDRDTSFALVFTDDAGALYVRREGRLAGLAAERAYRVVPAGAEGLYRLREASIADRPLRAAATAELERRAQDSRFNAIASSLLGEFAAFENRFDEARRRLEHAIRVDPLGLRYNERLGVIHLITGRPREALDAFRRERSLRSSPRGIDLRLAQAYQRLGDLSRAREHYRREIATGIYGTEAGDSLAALDRTAGR